MKRTTIYKLYSLIMLSLYFLILFAYNWLKPNKQYKYTPNIGLIIASLTGIIMTNEETWNFKGVIPI